MRQLVSITFNDRSFSAYPGDLLLDAALLNGVGMPHDCRSGGCGTCVVRVLSGQTQGGQGSKSGTVHACQTRVLSDLVVASETTKATVDQCPGRIKTITSLAEDVLELAIEPTHPILILPGQYMQLEFAGFPQRAFSPTLALDGRPRDGLMRFHVCRRANGRVSSALGGTIAAGHRVKLRGPFGSAYLQRGLQNRLILVCGGTGFAPIWAIADAALRERPSRSMLLIVGVRSVRGIYMVQALDRMATCPNVRIFVTSEEQQSMTPVILTGRPTDYLPPMLSRDVVFAAGPPALVSAVAETAAISNATFHADAFVAADDGDERGWLRRLFSRSRSQPMPVADASRGRSSASVQVGLDRLPHAQQASAVHVPRQLQR